MKSGIKIEVFDNKGEVVLEGEPAAIIEDLVSGLVLAVDMISKGFEDEKTGKEEVLEALFKLTREEFKKGSSQPGEEVI